MISTHSRVFKPSLSFFGLTFVLFICSIAGLTLTCGCGKNESAGTVVGGATGAIIGAAVSGGHNQGTGALIGGLAGSLLGSTAGRAADDEDREEEHAVEREHQSRLRAHQEACHSHEIAHIQAENRILKQTIVRWCASCNREINLVGANSCPACGGQLIHERFCKMCATTFSPKSGYRYCPYCRDGILLSIR